MKSSDLKHDFLSFISDKRLLKSHEKTLLAVSGGIDSVVMAHLFHLASFGFGIAHCNFNLRGAEADKDEALVKEIAEKYEAPFFSTSFDTEKYARKNKLSIQMAARELRYEWFEHLRLNENYDKIAFAHHVNDQAETMLLNLAKGTGISGFRGMPVKRGNIIRPLLFASRTQIDAYANDHSLAFRTDESNKSVKYERNLIRHELIPVLEKINPAFISTLSRTVDNVRFAETLFGERLAFYKNRLLEDRKDGIYIPFRRLKSYPFPAQLLYELLRDFGFYWDQVKNVVSLSDESSGQEFLSEAWRLMKNRNLLILSPIDSSDAARIYIEKKNQQVLIQSVKIRIEIKDRPPKLSFSSDGSVAMLDAEKLDFPLVFRPWKKGDYFYPFGLKKPSGKVGKKKLSDLFTDLKFSQPEKEQTWVLQSGEKIAWVAGHRIDDRFKVTSSTKKIALFRLESDY